MKHLPLYTALVLVLLIGLWNLSSYDLEPGALVSAAAPRPTPDLAHGGAPVQRLDPGSGARLEVPPTGSTEPGATSQPPRPEPEAGGAGAGWHHAVVDVEHDADGHVVARGPRIDGLRAGWWSLSWPHGALKGEGEYRAGRRVGPWAFWHASGELRARGSYRDDKREGVWLEWHEGGSVAGRASYDDGELDGLWEQTYSNGQVREKGRFVRGLREGPWEFYDFEGRVDVRTGTYVRGQRSD